MLIYEVGTDGNCMFRSVSFLIYGTEDLHMLVRDKCMDYILQDKNYFKDYIDLDRFRDIDDYCEHKKNDGIWGDHIELQAIAEIYNRPIEIYAYSD